MAGTAIGFSQSHVAVLGGADDGSFGDKRMISKMIIRDFPKNLPLSYDNKHMDRSGRESCKPRNATVPVEWKNSLIMSGEIRPRVRSAMIWKVTPTPIQKGFGTINYIVLIVYLLIMVGVGFICRKK